MCEAPDVVLAFSAFEDAGYGEERCIVLVRLIPRFPVRLGENLSFSSSFMKVTRPSNWPGEGILLAMLMNVLMFIIS